jgi:hypothetical protein
VQSLLHVSVFITFQISAKAGASKHPEGTNAKGEIIGSAGNPNAADDNSKDSSQKKVKNTYLFGGIYLHFFLSFFIRESIFR